MGSCVFDKQSVMGSSNSVESTTAGVRFSVNYNYATVLNSTGGTVTVRVTKRGGDVREYGLAHMESRSVPSDSSVCTAGAKYDVLVTNASAKAVAGWTLSGHMDGFFQRPYIFG